MSLILLTVIVGAVVAGLVWLLVYRLQKRVPDKVRLAEWAMGNGFEILSANRRWILTGPYWYCKWPVVYRIRVRDEAGNEKAGWLCIEAPFYAINMEIKWS